MAEAVSSDTDVPNARWYCHQCDAEIKPSLPEFVCSQCKSGFIEPLEETADTGEDITAREPRAQFSSNATHPMPGGRGYGRHAHFAIRQLPAGANPFQDFISQVLGSIMGGVMHQGPINIQIAPWLMGQNAGDYVLSAGGLDNVITTLLNQIDGAGPPPAAKDQIDALPTVLVVQEQVDSSLQCHICMEEFQLDEKVRGLPCKHIYHGECIVPWLQLHGTCPVCRKRVEVVRQADRPPPSTELLPD